jgi:uncharacterized protein (DUF2141 family)
MAAAPFDAGRIDTHIGRMAHPRRRYALAVAALLALPAWSGARGQVASDIAALVTPAAEIEACKKNALAIHIVVENVRNAKGIVTAELYVDRKAVFLKKAGRLMRMRVPASKGRTELCLVAPEAGDYTVAVFHDENADKKFDRDFFGIPSEGYGFSNNPGFRFGLPAMEEIRFAVKDRPTTLSITLTYL